MDRLTAMRVFQRVADDGGFAAAARSLELSPAAVTRFIADLEAHLGVRLLQRTTRRVALTDAGQAYLARVRQILSDVDEAFASAQSHRTELSGTLRVLTNPVLATHVLAPLVLPFRERFPGIVLDVHVDSPIDPPVEEFDVTLLGSGVRLGAEVIARPIVESYAIVCAAPSYLAKAGPPRSPEELASHACLRLRQPGSRPGLWRLWPDAQAETPVEVEVTPALVANHTDTLLGATLEGAGVSSQPVDLIAPYLCNGRLVRLLDPWITGRFTLFAAMPSRKFMPARTRAFVDFLTESTRRTVDRALSPADPGASPDGTPSSRVLSGTRSGARPRTR